MKKQIKKGLAFLGAAALSLGLISAPAIEARAEGETIAYISFADGSWSDAQYWNDGAEHAVKATTADVTGYGQYTVSLDFTGTEAGKAADTAFFDVEIANGESAYPDSFMQIDSVKVNGTDVAVGKTYTSSDDGVATRTNLYNEWVPEVTEGRTADGDSTDVTAVPVDKASVVDVETLEITFTLMEGVKFGGAAAFEPMEGPARAYLNINTPDWSEYTKESADVEVNGDGDYSIEMTMADGIQLGQFNALEFENGEMILGTASIVTVTGIEINGEAIDLAGESYTCSADGAGVNTRVNLYNEYNDPDATAVAGDDSHLDQRATGDVASASARIIPESYTYKSEYTVTSIKVNFTVSGFGTFAEAGEAAPVEIPTEFTAFLMFADGSGAWENYNMGVGTECTVIGDGVYEVSLSAAQCGATEKAAPIETATVFLVDIDGLGLAMVDKGTLTATDDADEKLIVTDAKVKVAVFVDGVKISSKSKNIKTGDIEGNGRFRLDFFNPYDGSNTNENPVCALEDLTPESEIKVVFSLEGTGLNEGADTDLDAYCVAKGYVEATEDTAAATEAATEGAVTTTAKSGANPVVIIIVVVVVAAAVVGGVLFAKKKKDNK